MSKTRPFNFKIHAAEFFSAVQKIPMKDRAAFVTQFSTDLITLEPVTEYGKHLIQQTIDLIQKQSDYGKLGGKPAHRVPKGRVKGALQKPIGKPYPEVEVKREEETLYAEIIADLNKKGGFKFTTTSKSTIGHINARFAEGFTKEDFFHVHTVKIAEWRNDPKMAQYLRPSTLYNSEKFQGYVNQKIIDHSLFVLPKGVIPTPENHPLCVTPEWL